MQRHLDERARRGRDDDADWLATVRETHRARACATAPPTIDTVAERLALSVRTLQRRLGEHGIVFKRLVGDVRRDLALRYLADGKSDLTEIAFLVGYSELQRLRPRVPALDRLDAAQHQKQLRSG